MILDTGCDKDTQVAYSAGTMTLTDIASRMCMTIVIYDDDKVIARNVRFFDTCDFGYVETESGDAMVLQDGKNYHSCMKVTWIPKGTNALRSMVANADAYASATDVINSVTIDDPVHKCSPADGPIKVSYDRSSSSVDYCFKENRNKETGNEKVSLKVAGSAILDDNHKFSKITSGGASLKCKGYGEIVYGGSVAFGNKGDKGVVFYPLSDKNGFGWNLEEDWQDEIEDSVRYGNRWHDFDMAIYFKCENDDNEYELLITSFGTELIFNQKHVQRISQIQLMWGCLAEDTLVYMEDGSTKKIQDVAKGDKLMSPKDGAVEVDEVVTGNEANIYTVLLENGKTVRASRNHPFATNDGFVAVINLDSQTELATKDGASRVVYCYPDTYNGKVYSLKLKNGDRFYADDFVSGTNDIQGKLADSCLEEKEMNITSPEETAERIKMEEDFEKGLI
jgi:hypothetical protein